jgi:tRNA pseudouridine55 synthase
MSPAHAHGILLLDKPIGVSSFGALHPVKRAFGGKKGAKIGHAGTLDPAASGLLVVGVGSGTRLLEFLEAMPKRYSFRLNLGLVTDSYDLEGTVLERHEASHVTRADLEALLPEFLGPISQMPPTYSAIKIDGKRACDRVRDGETVTLKARHVRIDRIEILTFEPGNITLEMDCSKGTYVRSLAHDLGQRLGCGAAADLIRRLRIGPFRVEDAVAIPAPCIDEAGERIHTEDEPSRFINALLPLETAVADLPTLLVHDAGLAGLRNGNPLPSEVYSVTKAPAITSPDLEESDTESETEYAVYSEQNVLLCTATRDQMGRLCPRKVFPAALAGP